MSDAVGLKGPTNTLVTPAWIPLDETLWAAWKAKGRAQDKRGRETRIRALKWGSIVALLAVAAIWSRASSYDIVIRSLLAAGAAGAMFEAFNKRQYTFGALFAGLVLLYNPVAPVFGFSGNWQRALVVLSAAPFAASLARRDMKEAQIG